MATVITQGDLLGYVRVRATGETVNHVETYLDQQRHYDADGQLTNPPSTLGRLYLVGTDLYLSPSLDAVPVQDAVTYRPFESMEECPLDRLFHTR